MRGHFIHFSTTLGHRMVSLLQRFPHFRGLYERGSTVIVCVCVLGIPMGVCVLSVSGCASVNIYRLHVQTVGVSV